MLKSIFKYVLKIVIYLLSSTIVIYLYKKVICLRNYIYSEVISRLIKQSIGPCLFEYPLVIKGPQYIEVGQNFSSRSRLRIEAWDQYRGEQFKPVIKIGDNVNINFDCHIGAINKIEIGNNVLIGSRVLIIDHNHGEANISSIMVPPIERPLFSKGSVVIEDNVWIGEGVCILPNVRVGMNSIIGANSVVTMDIPANCIVGGVPAKILKRL
jgi:acetyltransferase-like isoleucine patch superfamily enzyme